MSTNGTGAKKKRKSPDGVPTNDLVFSAYTGANDDVFLYILSLYVAPGSTVADVTYGRGVFWRKVPEGAFHLLPTDLSTGTDCRQLPYEDGSVDCVVFDPPYMHTPGGTAHVNHQNYEGYYKNNKPIPTRNITKPYWICISPRRTKLGECCGEAASTSSNVKTRSVPTNNG